MFPAPLWSCVRLREGKLSRDPAVYRDRDSRELAGYWWISCGPRANTKAFWSGGPRATQSLIMASRASAAVSGRDFVTPDDIQSHGVPVLEHRLILRPNLKSRG